MAESLLLEVSIGPEVTLASQWGEMRVRHVRCGLTEGVVSCFGQHRGSSDELPVRIQSSCIFSESLGAIDCDCNDQLKASLGVISQEGGLLVYVWEEGRGAGIEKKIESIRLQQESGLNTAEAFGALGLPPDLRDHRFAASVIMSIAPNAGIVLLTNDPRKGASLKQWGVEVKRLRPLVVVRNGLVQQYLHDKVRALGHELHA